MLSWGMFISYQHECTFRVRTGHGKPGKSWNLIIVNSRPGKCLISKSNHWKSWKNRTSHWKLWNLKIFNKPGSLDNYFWRFEVDLKQFASFTHWNRLFWFHSENSARAIFWQISNRYISVFFGGSRVADFLFISNGFTTCTRQTHTIDTCLYGSNLDKNTGKMQILRWMDNARTISTVECQEMLPFVNERLGYIEHGRK